ncbi:MAG: NAD(P)/FAD-dependent oxidoreductase [Acidimicrobiales bacterium]
MGAGPAGLTSAYLLGKRGVRCTVLEADAVPGGIARTVERDGWRFDVGGHRFFTKVREVEELWHEILGPSDLLRRPRLSRIYYGGKFFDYPIQIANALRGLGFRESVRCGLSYLWVRLHPPAEPESYETWVASRFGWRLYEIFFKGYTEKVWGMPAAEIQADWAAQRIKTLSLSKAILNALSLRRNQRSITSLIEEFEYPRLGPGMMWERATELVRAQGSEVRLSSPVVRLRRHENGGVVAVEIGMVRGDRAESDGGTRGKGEPGALSAAGAAVGAAVDEIEVDHVISSMPLSDLVLMLDPPAPEEVRLAAKGLRYRDFLTIALIVPAAKGFPDNWIYVHDPKVRLGRIQNFGSWSPEMVKDGWTCLGLEYFVFENDELWQMADADLVRLGADELASIDLVDAASVEAGYVVRMPKAYPVYDPGYDERVETIRGFVEREVPNLYPVGRNGMHRYNNQDHSMLTAMLTIENLFGEEYDTWAVNVEAEYHEEQVKRRSRPGPDGTASGEPPDGAGTGRGVPKLVTGA